MLVQPGSKLSPGITCKSKGFVGATTGCKQLATAGSREVSLSGAPFEAGWELLSPEG